MGSNSLVFGDESGDHNLTSPDSQYPVFVLVFVVATYASYVDEIVPAMLRLKLKYFGHPEVILHEREIRKARTPFDGIAREGLLPRFHADIAQLIGEAKFRAGSVIIGKNRMVAKYARPHNPYEFALKLGLERLDLLGARSGAETVIIERRGGREDAQLGRAFELVCGGDNWNGNRLSYRPLFVDKKSNSSGLQLADLIARPIGQNYLDPAKASRAYGVIEPKLGFEKVFP